MQKGGRIINTRKEHIDNMQVGNIVAFKSGEEMFSGKVLNISDKVAVQTLNNSIFYVDKQDVVWVKNGSHWPVGIYNALRYSRNKK